MLIEYLLVWDLVDFLLEPWTCFIIFAGYLHITAMCSKAYIVYTCTQKPRVQDKLSYAKILEIFSYILGIKYPWIHGYEFNEYVPIPVLPLGPLFLPLTDPWVYN